MQQIILSWQRERDRERGGGGREREIGRKRELEREKERLGDSEREVSYTSLIPLSLETSIWGFLLRRDKILEADILALVKSGAIELT